MGINYFAVDYNYKNLINISAFNDPSLVQFMHRNLAYLILIYYLFILVNVYKKNLYDFFKITKSIGALLLIQIFLGIFTLLSGAQMLVSSMHQISSIFLVSSIIYFLYSNSETN